MAVPSFEPADAGFADRVRASFERQGALKTFNVALTAVEPGRSVMEFPWSEQVTQQHGFVHAGVLGAVMDTACGYAAFSLMPADAAVLTIEYKVNLLAPARGQLFRVQGEVLKPGRTITVSEGRAWALDGEKEKLVATMTCTLMAVFGREGIQH
ncbi:PaaI family thioesterase [Ramlibacter sp.]|uniref:PaaI family thioesterase n=1 Tax=Ramlibacter sp. TaxID=1917967 RepID=UPI00180AF769|nr:PaaI family thioesterase [Ramlibacter sp.]MBA2673179.1 PaaI family thioesterase [Ramlibacter sp.]